MKFYWRSTSLVLLLIILISLIYFYFRLSAPSKVVINKNIPAEKILQPSVTTLPGNSSVSNAAQLKSLRRKKDEIPLEKLVKPLNKSLNMLDIEPYFKTPNVQEKKQEYAETITTFRKKYMAPSDIAQYQTRPELRFVQQVPAQKQVAGQTLKKEYEVFYDIASGNINGSRIIEAREVQKDTWETKAQQNNNSALAQRVVFVELPRRFEDFSLGDTYKTNSDTLQIKNNPNWQNSNILESVEGQLFQGKMYYFVINFQKTVDPYYLAAVLQNIFGTEAFLRKIGNYLVFNWSDERTKIEYTIYNDNACRLHFYDIGLGRQKINSYH